MALINKRIGAPATVTRGRKGERPDFYPGKLVSQPETIIGANGRPMVVADVITLETNRNDEEYLAYRPAQNLAFAFDRFDRVEQLDGTTTEPKTWQQLVAEQAKAAMAHLMARPASTNEVALDDIEA